MTPEQEALIESHLDLPKRITRRYYGRYRDEIVDEARLALVMAANDYETSRGVPFEAYATIRIKWALGDLFRKYDNLPRTRRPFFKRVGEMPIVYRRSRLRREERPFVCPVVHIDAGAWRKGLWMEATE